MCWFFEIEFICWKIKRFEPWRYSKDTSWWFWKTFLKIFVAGVFTKIRLDNMALWFECILAIFPKIFRVAGLMINVLLFNIFVPWSENFANIFNFNFGLLFGILAVLMLFSVDFLYSFCSFVLKQCFWLLIFRSFEQSSRILWIPLMKFLFLNNHNYNL